MLWRTCDTSSNDTNDAPDLEDAEKDFNCTTPSYTAKIHAGKKTSLVIIHLLVISTIRPLLFLFFHQLQQPLIDPLGHSAVACLDPDGVPKALLLVSLALLQFYDSQPTRLW
jgi:hypothetical protein